MLRGEEHPARDNERLLLSLEGEVKGARRVNLGVGLENPAGCRSVQRRFIPHRSATRGKTLFDIQLKCTLMPGHTSHLDGVDAHIRSFFVGHTITKHVWSLGPTAELIPEFFVLCVHPYANVRFWTYVSIGASAVAHDGGRLLEFVTIAPDKDLRHVELLTMAAFYHKTEWLEVGHTFPIGEPWLSGSKCNQMLVSLLYPFEQRLATCCLQDMHIHLLWLLPITLAERRFKALHGLEALEQKFEQHQMDCCDVARTSVV